MCELYNLCAFSLVLAITAFHGDAIAADKTGDNYLPHQELNHADQVKAFQQLVSAPAQKKTVKNETISIAIVHPKDDVSDFWQRSLSALTMRLSELGIAFKIREFISKQVEHSLQTRYTDEILANQGDYDFVIFGPSSLETQADNIRRLAASESFETLIWAFHTPPGSWQHQPLAWFDFSSQQGAELFCNYLIARLGKNVSYFLNRGMPGITDTHRSRNFSDCVQEKGGWNLVYEHFGQYQTYGGADGAAIADENFTDAAVIHNANTAMAVGSINELRKRNSLEKFFVTGWGGTEYELALIQKGEMNATPMRLNDDVGVATAEAIRLVLEDKTEKIPNIYLGRITVACDGMSDQELLKLKKEAFRYSN